MMGSNDKLYLRDRSKNFLNRFKAFVGNTPKEVALYDCLQAFFRPE